MINPKAKWTPSPNFRETSGRKISCVVLHATATPGLKSPLSWLTNPESKVSAHYLIDLNGDLYQLVDENNDAWHAGVSVWNGHPSVNLFSIGIELVNSNNGTQKYPKEQIDTALSLVSGICKEHNIKVEDVVAHADIAPGRKNDPLDFPWTDFRASLRKALA